MTLLLAIHGPPSTLKCLSVLWRAAPSVLFSLAAHIGTLMGSVAVISDLLARHESAIMWRYRPELAGSAGTWRFMGT